MNDSCMGVYSISLLRYFAISLFHCLSCVNVDFIVFHLHIKDLVFNIEKKHLYLCINRLIMTTKDLRKEINRVIQKVPDDFLTEILSYLKEFENKPGKDVESLKHLKQIFREDQELLEKLAK